MVRMKLQYLSALVVCLGLGVWAFFVEPNRLVLHEETLVLENWPKTLDGLRVAVISDIHAGAPFIDAEKLQNIVATTNQKDRNTLPGMSRRGASTCSSRHASAPVSFLCAFVCLRRLFC